MPDNQEPRVVKDKTLAQVGDLYEIHPEELDSEEVYMIDAARKKYEVRKMLDKSVSDSYFQIYSLLKT